MNDWIGPVRLQCQETWLVILGEDNACADSRGQVDFCHCSRTHSDVRALRVGVLLQFHVAADREYAVA